jgi:hypothetical protein
VAIGYPSIKKSETGKKAWLLTDDGQRSAVDVAKAAHNTSLHRADRFFMQVRRSTATSSGRRSTPAAFFRMRSLSTVDTAVFLFKESDVRHRSIRGTDRQPLKSFAAYAVS